MKQEPLVDSYGRHINYLRISLTEACNFRCLYCVPPEGVAHQSSANELTQTELVRFVRIAGQLGIHRFRLTGGEPLLRQDILQIVRCLKEINTVHDLSVTTNGSRLRRMALALKQNGLDRLNVSLDSMSPERFRKITGADRYTDVMEGIYEALRIGFPVKLNMVVLDGLGEDEIIQFVNLAFQYPLEVRFLEFMPLCGNAWLPHQVIPIREIKTIVSRHFQLEVIPRNGDVAQSYQLVGGKGKVGFIGSLTESFCNECSRMRISANGNIQPCLFSHDAVSVGHLLKNTVSDEELMQAIRKAVQIKSKGNQFRDKPFDPKESFESLQLNPMIRTIGG